MSNEISIETVRSLLNALMREMLLCQSCEWYTAHILILENVLTAVINLTTPGPINIEETTAHNLIRVRPTYEQLEIAIERCEQLLDESTDQWDELITEFILRG